MSVHPKRFGPGLAAAIALLLSAAAGAELEPWNAGEVKGLARQLATASNAWETVARDAEARIGGGEITEKLLGRARVLRERSTALADHLEKGKGRDETVGEFEAIREVADDTQELVERGFQDDPAMGAWSKVTGLIDQLAPYYDPRARPVQ